MISIIVPTYNEKANLPILLRQLVAVGQSGKANFEIVVVDDNSPDATAKVARQLSKSMPVRLLVRQNRSGLSSAIMDGAKFARGDQLVIIDADLSHPPEKAFELASHLRAADLVIASRNLSGGGVEEWPLPRHFISIGATWLSRLVIRSSVSDPMSGFFAIRRKLFIQTPLRVHGYKILMNVLAHYPKLRIKEIPYLFRNRKVGASKMGVKETFIFLGDVLRLLFK